jgi:hypothetical protein
MCRHFERRNRWKGREVIRSTRQCLPSLGRARSDQKHAAVFTVERTGIAEGGTNADAKKKGKEFLTLIRRLQTHIS